jgi:Cyclin, N-terminal domain
VFPDGVADIDIPGKRTDQYDPTYAHAIMSELKTKEATCLLNVPVLGPRGSQTEITEHMRVILLDWLSEINEEFRLSTSTFFLTTHLLDCILKRTVVTKQKFQLLGCVCVLLAAKLEDIVAPSVENLTTISDHCFEANELIQL